MIWNCEKILVSDNSLVNSLFSLEDLSLEIFTAKIFTVGYPIYPCLRVLTRKDCETVLSARTVIHACGRTTVIFSVTACVSYLHNLLKMTVLKEHWAL